MFGRDPKYWDNPESFIPQRFDNNSIDSRGNHFEFIPFSAGRRMCPGLLFGLVNIEYPLAHLLCHFDWKTPYEDPLENFHMTEIDGLILIFSSLLLFLSGILCLRKESKTLNKRLPPGPWRLPFIGNLHQLMNGRLTHHTLRDLSQRYGPIFHLCLGEVSHIVASSPDIAKEIMKIQDLYFATRPPLMVGEIIMYNHSDIGTCPYGDYWRNMRKVCIIELLSTKMVKSFDSIRQAEMSSLISSINSMPNSLINLSDKIFWFTSSVTCRSAFGKIIHGQDKLIMLMKDITFLAGGTDLADLFPSRKWLHRISLKTRVLINVWAIGRDPEYWDNPESFIPERFDNNSIDFRGNHFQFIPFGAGRRMCPGLLFGLLSVEHPLAQLLYHFNWKTPYEGPLENFDMTETDGAKKISDCIPAKRTETMTGAAAEEDQITKSIRTEIL